MKAADIIAILATPSEALEVSVLGRIDAEPEAPTCRQCPQVVFEAGTLCTACWDEAHAGPDDRTEDWE